jgi:streptogrisin C
MRPLLFALLAAMLALPSLAAAEPRRLSAEEALARDAAAYAAAFQLSADEALLRLRRQQASIRVTDQLRSRYRERLASISIEHRPDWAILVRLAGEEKPADQVVSAEGLAIRVRFEAGVPSTREKALALLDRERHLLPRLVPGYHGAGVDPLSGGLLVMQRPGPDRRSLAEAEAALTARLGIPVRLRRLHAVMADGAAIGGGRVQGRTPDGRLWRCTTGFVVRNADGRTGVTTAAHCPDELSWRGPKGEERLLPMAEAWGAAHHDIQIHTGLGEAAGLFYADANKSEVRPVTSWVTRPMTRHGDFLCLRGESSGFACSVVELTDFAPAGELCGGLCAASWVTLAGPNCRRGDSGAPIFSGTRAYGVLKGGAYLAGGACAFSFYQSVDYLPGQWRLVTAS